MLLTKNTGYGLRVRGTVLSLIVACYNKILIIQYSQAMIENLVIYSALATSQK